MVSLWPFKGDETSTAAFEKTLSNLSEKISKANVANAGLKQRSRRFRALWTLYACFIYILYTLILALVTGWQRWSAVEYSAIAGGPLVIYIVRAILTSYYDYRISNKQAQLEELQKQKTAAVEKFKAATRYNSTQQLLEKYGAEDKSHKQRSEHENPRKTKDSTSKTPKSPKTPARTNIAPPPTANIQRPSQLVSQQPTEMEQRRTSITQTQVVSQPSSPEDALRGPEHSPQAEFAPNAMPTSPQYMDRETGHAKWYDRVMDVLLGDDDNRPINRIALLCTNCRLVNGQAPPGVKTEEELGRWRCFNCQAWNGKENAVQEAITIAKEQQLTAEPEQDQMKMQDKAVEPETPSKSHEGE